MRHVRPVVLPLLSSNFLELNLRTYVRDCHGVPGIWFYSLDANQPFAVWIARLFFSLPYLHAKMHLEDRNEEIRYFCRRRGSARPLIYQFRLAGDIGEAKIGSLEFLLIERHRLFASRARRLETGRVYHSPYRLQKAVVSIPDKSLFEQDGLRAPSELPTSLLYSAGGDVTVYRIDSVS